MKRTHHGLLLLVGACLLLLVAGCGDKHEPLKPTVILSTALSTALSAAR